MPNFSYQEVGCTQYTTNSDPAKGKSFAMGRKIADSRYRNSYQPNRLHRHVLHVHYFLFLVLGKLVDLADEIVRKLLNVVESAALIVLGNGFIF